MTILKIFLLLENSKWIIVVFFSVTHSTNIGVPQGSPLSSSLFLIVFQFVLDSLKTMGDEVFYAAYADDLLIYSNIKDNKINESRMKRAIDLITSKGDEIGLHFSEEKTKSMHICRKKEKNRCAPCKHFIYGKEIKAERCITYLGLKLQCNYKFDHHVNYLKEKIKKDMNVVRMLSARSFGTNQDILNKIVKSLIISKIKYCIEIYGFTSQRNVYTIDTLLNKIKRMVTCSFCTTPITTLNIQSGILNFEEIRLNAVLDTYPTLTEDLVPLECARSRCRISLREELERIGMFSEEDDVISFTKILQDVQYISPQDLAYKQVCTC